jgi:hypothetical protein
MLDQRTMAIGASILERHVWFVGVNNTPSFFYTSDCPLVRYARIADFTMSRLGLGSVGVELRFPLSPTHVLVMRERTFDKTDAGLEGRVIPLTDEQVSYYNLQQVLQSTRQVYSLDGSFDAVRETCARRPDVCDPNREHVKVIDRAGVVQFRRIR